MLIDHTSSPEAVDNAFKAFGGKKQHHEKSDSRMILYDSHRWKTFFRLRGSILPKAFSYGLIPSVAAFFLKLCVQEGWLDIPDSIEHASAYSTFIWTVGFLLVFRTSQCYTRFWACAVGSTNLRSQLYEAISSLMSFCAIAKTVPEADMKVFKMKIVQLVSLFHAMSMASVSGQTHREFPVICANLMPKKNIEFLLSIDGEARVEVSYQWICTLVMKEASDGVLKHVAPPLMNGCMQELYLSMREYAAIHQIVTLPFPFPYSQVCLVMIMVYMVTTPFAMISWAAHPFAAFAYTLMSATCFWSLELIAAELENPFGDDVNDLPVFSFQNDVNNGLLLLIDPTTDSVYELDEAAKAVAGKWHTIDGTGVIEKVCDIVDSSGILHLDVEASRSNDAKVDVMEPCKPPHIQKDLGSLPPLSPEVLPVVPVLTVVSPPAELSLMERFIQQQEARGRQQAEFENKMLGCLSGIQDTMNVVEELFTRCPGFCDTMTSRRPPLSSSSKLGSPSKLES